MDSKFYNKKNGRWAPTFYVQRLMNNEIAGYHTDAMIRQQYKKAPQKGIKTIFLEEYEKNGYESAKKLVNDRFETEVYSDIILLGWLGIDAKKEIINAYNQNFNYEDAYKIAEEINEKIKYSVLSRALVNTIIEKELKKENVNRDEDDDAR